MCPPKPRTPAPPPPPPPAPPAPEKTARGVRSASNQSEVEANRSASSGVDQLRVNLQVPSDTSEYNSAGSGFFSRLFA